MDTKRLLLIDDNEDHRLLVKLALESKTDWEVLLARDGIEGIAKAEMERPDAILLDLVMPDLDGLTVCEILKSNLFTCSIPIVFITAMVRDEILARLENTWAEGVIAKPCDVINLNSKIAEICKWELISQISDDYSKIC